MSVPRALLSNSGSVGCLSKNEGSSGPYRPPLALPLHERMHTADRTTAYMCMHTLHPHAHALHDALHAALHDVVAGRKQKFWYVVAVVAVDPAMPGAAHTRETEKRQSVDPMVLWGEVAPGSCSLQ